MTLHRSQDGPRHDVLPDEHGAAPRTHVGTNRVLSLLSSTTRERLTPHLHPVTLERREVLFGANERLTAVHFPVSCVISFVAALPTGETLEVGLVGRDGLAPAASVLTGVATMPCDGIVQVPGTALRLDAVVLRRELLRDEHLHDVIGRHAQVLLVRSMQMSICNVFHSVEQRCVRWLLTVHDLTMRDDLPITHESIAAMLGVRRPTVSLVLGTLQHAGLVKEARGHVRLLDRSGLERVCCECYAAMRSEEDRLLTL